MYTTMMICAAAVAFGGALLAADSEVEIAKKLVALERQAMDGWVKGNPDADLATLDPSITLFHPPNEKRLDGLDAVKQFYEKYRGMTPFDSYEIVEPKVQVSGDIAVLTFHFDCQGMAGAGRYFASQVWQQKKEGWRMIHAQWSKVRTQ